MSALLSEWIKIRTTKANIVLASLAVSLPLLIGSLLAAFADFDDEFNDVYPNTVIGPATITVFLCGVLGVLCIGQEYRHSTIRTTFAATPRRSTVLTAKVVITALIGAGLGAITVGLLTVSTTLLAGSSNNNSTLFTPGENLTATVGLLVLCALFALCGFAVGAIIRQPAGAIPTLLLWPLLVEGLLGGVLSIWFDGASKYLPFQSAFRLPARSADSFDSFSRLGAGLYFGAWTAALVALGWFLVERRDA